MGRSLFRPAPANTIEDYTKNNEYYHPLSDTHYSMIVRDGAYYQRRWQIGFGGKETNVEESRIDYVLVRATTPAPISIALLAEHSSSCRLAGIRKRAATGR